MSAGARGHGCVIVQEQPARVIVLGTHGGGYSKCSTQPLLVIDAAAGLNYALYGQRPVALIAPEWVCEKLRAMGYKV